MKAVHNFVVSLLRSSDMLLRCTTHSIGNSQALTHEGGDEDCFSWACLGLVRWRVGHKEILRLCFGIAEPFGKTFSQAEVYKVLIKLAQATSNSRSASPTRHGNSLMVP